MRDGPGIPKVHGYRWVVLAVFMVVTALNQLCWITFAAITTDTAAFYHAGELAVGLLSLSFMAVYVLIFLPSAWAIDSLGFRAAVTIGAVLTAVGALGRGVFAGSFAAVFAFQIVIALGQPFVLGAITKLAAQWFPARERATAAGLATLAIYLGILAGVAATPVLFAAAGMQGMLLAWGIASVAGAAAFAALARERPPTPPSVEGAEARSLVLDGLRSMLRKRDFLLLLLVFFVGLGIFNGVTTWIEQIVAPRGFDATQAGIAGGMMLAGGIAGAIVMPLVSDSTRRRKPFLVVSLAGMIPGLLGLAYAGAYPALLGSAFVFGFFLLSSGPIGFQYGAEITLPAPEGTSNTLLLMAGNLAGIVFIFGMDALRGPGGSMTASLLGLVTLTAACAVLALFLGESPIRTAKR
jgi:cyanate permease